MPFLVVQKPASKAQNPPPFDTLVGRTSMQGECSAVRAPTRTPGGMSRAARPLDALVPRMSCCKALRLQPALNWVLKWAIPDSYHIPALVSRRLEYYGCWAIPVLARLS